MNQLSATRFFVTTLGILAIGCPTWATAAPSLESIVYQEDFEGLSAGTLVNAQGWSTFLGQWSSGESADVVSGGGSPFSPTGTNYLDITDLVGDGENLVGPAPVALPTDKLLYFAFDVDPQASGRWQLRTGASGPIFARWIGDNDTVSMYVNGVTLPVDLSSGDAWARVELTSRMTLAELEAGGGFNMYWDYSVTEFGGSTTTYTNLYSPVTSSSWQETDGMPQFQFGAGSSSPHNYDIDNLVIGVVPEPTTAALLLLGAAALLLHRRRRK